MERDKKMFVCVCVCSIIVNEISGVRHIWNNKQKQYNERQNKTKQNKINIQRKRKLEKEEKK